MRQECELFLLLRPSAHQVWFCTKQNNNRYILFAIGYKLHKRKVQHKIIVNLLLLCLHLYFLTSMCAVLLVVLLRDEGFSFGLGVYAGKHDGARTETKFLQRAV